MEAYPDKQVTILDANSHVCRLFPPSTQNYLEQWIRQRKNITLKLNTRIQKIITPFADDAEVETRSSSNGKKSQKTILVISQFMDIEQRSSDELKMTHFQLETVEKKTAVTETLEFDVVFRCAGFQPNSEILQTKQLDACLSEKYKFIKVDEWMRVCQHGNVFALGDVIDQPFINEIKLAHTAEIHARYLRDSMVHLHEHEDGLCAFKPYHEWLFGSGKMEKVKGEKLDMPLVYTISLGALDGSMGFGDIRLNGFVSQLLKWFIEISLCTLYQRSGLYDLQSFGSSFRIYPLGYRIFSVLWWFNHYFTMAYIRYTA